MTTPQTAKLAPTIHATKTRGSRIYNKIRSYVVWISVDNKGILDKKTFIVSEKESSRPQGLWT